MKRKLPLTLVFTSHEGIWDLDRKLTGWIFCTDEEHLEAMAKTLGIKNPEWGSTEFDPWELLERFVNLPDPDDQSLPIAQQDALLNFLSETGRFEQTSRPRNVDYFREWQMLIKKALLLPTNRWQGLSRKFDPAKVASLCNHTTNLSLGTKKNGPAEVRAANTLDAMLSALHLERWQFRFRECKECGRSFKPKQDRIMNYCSHKCQHRAVVRRGRKEARRQKKA